MADGEMSLRNRMTLAQWERLKREGLDEQAREFHDAMIRDIMARRKQGYSIVHEADALAEEIELRFRR